MVFLETNGFLQSSLSCNCGGTKIRISPLTGYLVENESFGGGEKGGSKPSVVKTDPSFQSSEDLGKISHSPPKKPQFNFIFWFV